MPMESILLASALSSSRGLLASLAHAYFTRSPSVHPTLILQCRAERAVVRK